MSGLFILDLTFSLRIVSLCRQQVRWADFPWTELLKKTYTKTCYEKWKKMLYTKDRKFGASLLLMAEEIRENGTDSFQ